MSNLPTDAIQLAISGYGGSDGVDDDDPIPAKAKAQLRALQDAVAEKDRRIAELESENSRMKNTKFFTSSGQPVVGIQQ